MILLFISDAAPYMTKAAQAINIFYPKIIRITCFMHGIHRACEKIRSMYPNVDRLISNIKKVFLKAPSRVQIFKSVESGLELPPQPIITRWGTWIQAVKYYAKNFERIVRVFDALNKEEAASIEIVHDLLHNINIRNKIIFISSNYGFMEESITKLVLCGQPLSMQIKIVTDAVDSIRCISSVTANPIKDKFFNVLEKNVGFTELRNISASLSGQCSPNEICTKYSISETLAFKFAPITSIDVERSFSMYKNAFRSNRQSLKI